MGLDETAALAAVLAMLTYPLAWFHYDTLLIPVVAWLVARPEFRFNAGVRWSVVVYFLLRTIPDMVALPDGSGAAAWLARNQNGLQVIGRLLLLLAVCLATRWPVPRSRTPTVSCGPAREPISV